MHRPYTARRWPGLALAAIVAAAVIVMACTTNGGETPDHGSARALDLPAVTFETATGNAPMLYVEVADTDELRTCGLMHRRSMPDDQAMLFVFQSDQSGPFWNRNTFIPLTLAWITADGTIAGLSDMEPVSPDDNPQRNALTYPPGQYRYVIEANRGWFERNGVAAGDRAAVQDAVAYGSREAVPICREKGL